MPNSMKRIAVARALARALATALVLGAAMGRAASAQTITLPTIRTFGPGPEERLMYALADTLQRLYAHEESLGTPEAKARATNALRYINRVLLAPLTDQQLRRVVVAKSDTQKLRILAGDRNVPEDDVPQLLLRAVQYSLAHVSEFCRTKLASDSSAGARIKTFLYGLQTVGTLDRESRNAELLACERHELRVRERAPALFFGGLADAERTAHKRPDVAAQVDSLARVATMVVVLRKVHNNWLFPVRDRAQAEVFWRQQGIAPLNVGSVAGSGAGGVAFTELASPLLKFFRTSVNAVLAAEKKDAKPGATQSGTGNAQANRASFAAVPEDSASKVAIQRLLTGGGLFNVGFAVPLTHFDWSDGDAAITSLIVPRFGVTAPVMGATSRDSTSLNADLGLEVHAKLQDLQDGVGLVAQVRVANAWGSRQFARTVGATAHNFVPYATTAVGFLFGRQYLVTASRGIAGPDAIRHSDWQIGLTVVRAPTAP